MTRTSGSPCSSPAGPGCWGDQRRRRSRARPPVRPALRRPAGARGTAGKAETPQQRDHDGERDHRRGTGGLAQVHDGVAAVRDDGGGGAHDLRRAQCPWVLGGVGVTFGLDGAAGLAVDPVRDHLIRTVRVTERDDLAAVRPPMDRLASTRRVTVIGRTSCVLGSGPPAQLVHPSPTRVCCSSALQPDGRKPDLDTGQHEQDDVQPDYLYLAPAEVQETPPTWISTSPVAAARARTGATPVSGAGSARARRAPQKGTPERCSQIPDVLLSPAGRGGRIGPAAFAAGPGGCDPTRLLRYGRGLGPSHATGTTGAALTS